MDFFYNLNDGANSFEDRCSKLLDIHFLSTSNSLLTNSTKINIPVTIVNSSAADIVIKKKHGQYSSQQLNENGKIRIVATEVVNKSECLKINIDIRSFVIEVMMSMVQKVEDNHIYNENNAHCKRNIEDKNGLDALIQAIDHQCQPDESKEFQDHSYVHSSDSISPADSNKTFNRGIHMLISELECFLPCESISLSPSRTEVSSQSPSHSLSPSPVSFDLRWSPVDSTEIDNNITLEELIDESEMREDHLSELALLERGNRNCNIIAEQQDGNSPCPAPPPNLIQESMDARDYETRWERRKLRLEQEAEKRARTIYQQWNKDNLSLEQAIDESLKEYIELYEHAHALRLKFEDEKSKWMALVMRLIAQQRIQPMLEIPGKESLFDRFEYIIEDEVAEEGQENAGESRSSVAKKRSLEHNKENEPPISFMTHLPEKRKKFTVPSLSRM